LNSQIQSPLLASTLSILNSQIQSPLLACTLSILNSQIQSPLLASTLSILNLRFWVLSVSYVLAKFTGSISNPAKTSSLSHLWLNLLTWITLSLAGFANSVFTKYKPTNLLPSSYYKKYLNTDYLPFSTNIL
jgi:hypothetical protein